MKTRSKVGLFLAATIVVAGLVVAFRPKPIVVDTAIASRGPLQETIDEEGKTRIHDHFILGATVGGKLRRVELHAGDSVRTGQVVAWIDPAPIEPRQTVMLQARLETARAAEREADALVERAYTEQDQAATDLDRAEKLFAQGVTSKESWERAQNAHSVAIKQLEAARSHADSARHEIDQARAALISEAGGQKVAPVALRSPVGGRVLRLVEQSEKVVRPGDPVIDIGFTPMLEVVAEFLTADAVKIRPGMDAIIDDWGGDRPLRARVRVVEPGAFTKVSALGVEEQRVNVVLDFTEDTANLADAYRVEVRVITWQSANVLKVPSSALFRSGEQWAVFRVSAGAAQRTIVKPGHHGRDETEILQGLDEGDSVVVHPSSELKDRARVTRSTRTQ